jgi:hypothetical protein
LSAAGAPQWTTPAQLSIGDVYPVDTELSHNGRRAAVRSGRTTGSSSLPVANALTIWDLTAAATPTGPLGAFTLRGEALSVAVGGYKPSDQLAMTNTRCLAIGSGISSFVTSGPHDQTYVDLINITGFGATSITSQVLGRTSASVAANQFAGYTNDAEITRDGAWGVVNADNYFFVIDVGNGTIKAVNIGDAPYGPAPTTPGSPLNLCTPNGAVDSVAVTNECAVITTSRSSGGVIDPWVYIYDFGSGNVVLEQQLLPSDPTTELDFGPHDLAITPDGTMAVVTGDHIVALFDLTTFSLLSLHYDPLANRAYQVQVDSVEVTNEHAVVIADEFTAPSGPLLWQIDIFNLSRTVPPFLTVARSYKDSSSPTEPTRTHDLALVPPDDTRAIVRTSFTNVIVSLTAPGPLPIANLVSPGGSNAHAYIGYNVATSGRGVSSDSVAVSYDVASGRVVAVTLGATEPAPSAFQGHVDFIDLTATISLSQQVIASGIGTGSFGSMPLDLAISRDRSEVAVRCSDDHVSSPLASGADVTVFPLTPPFVPPVGSIYQYGGRGFVNGIDSELIGTSGQATPRKRLISTSDDVVGSTGLVHLVDRP